MLLIRPCIEARHLLLVHAIIIIALSSPPVAAMTTEYKKNATARLSFGTNWKNMLVYAPTTWHVAYTYCFTFAMAYKDGLWERLLIFRIEIENDT